MAGEKIPRWETTVFVGETLQHAFSKSSGNLHPSSNVLELSVLFEPFGLIYSIQTYKPSEKDCETSSPSPRLNFSALFAYVKYYTKQATQKALKDLKGTKLHDKPLLLNLARQGKDEMIPLDITRSIDLAKPSYYLGYNGWRTSVHSLSQDALEFHEETGVYKCDYTCTVLLSLPDGRQVEATGKASHSAKNKSTAIQNSKKIAVTEARKAVFKETVLVVLDNGKVRESSQFSRDHLRIVTHAAKVAVHFLEDSYDHWRTE
ncbi:hypothetical protein PROFUN_06277 [Planoprotostelium fungivorum]|uniref:RRM domain-containing protein n=1 Tax=Planoprotostelium fungivorum TaxID=1890364 RepID=A0A2P6NEB1_9EUKA|nr:hypothetical protein PROFUN_06277 [Planoprotostelium fungivorum]